MLFDWLERMPVPEGYKAEVVGGAVCFWPQRDAHWHNTIGMVEQLRSAYPRNRLKSDVRIDFPGHLNGFASDVVAMAEGATTDDEGRWSCQDIDFVAEVTSRETSRNDHGPKKDAYALAGVPVYLIVDPYIGRCYLFTDPKDGTYRLHPAIAFGGPVDLTRTVVGLTLDTAEFDRG
ncbi:Uma2 family endonuclease [Streptomyces sp. NPDC059788]|uniref:Uma2 family endonuclease n=1 Tax=Streptomyces sp. NPDC059788 TaxID=3346948 RepID=UPI0036691F1C